MEFKYCDIIKIKSGHYKDSIGRYGDENEKYYFIFIGNSVVLFNKDTAHLTLEKIN